MRCLKLERKHCAIDMTKVFSNAFTEECEDPQSQKQALDEEKKQREHLLALNQVIARQVMEKSRMVAGNIFLSSIIKIH